MTRRHPRLIKKAKNKSAVGSICLLMASYGGIPLIMISFMKMVLVISRLLWKSIHVLGIPLIMISFMKMALVIFRLLWKSIHVLGDRKLKF